jgi:hypothetical protein
MDRIDSTARALLDQAAGLETLVAKFVVDDRARTPSAAPRTAPQAAKHAAPEPACRPGGRTTRAPKCRTAV